MMNIVASKILKSSNISFGTSGARGLVVDFCDSVTAAFTHAFLDVISQCFDFETVALAIDNRPSSYSIAQACAAAINDHGFGVEFHGVIPTPALANYSIAKHIPSIMITGSHIPFDRNGMKFYRPDGEISKEDEYSIFNSNYSFHELTRSPELIKCSDAANDYIARYTSLFDKDILLGKKIGIYEHSSAGRDIYRELFTSLGAEVVSFGRSDEFVPIDTEAVGEEDRLLAKTWSKKHNFDAIFSTDGDGDRPLVSDENGNWLRGDILGLLTSIQLNIDALAVPVSCNTSIELCGEFKQVQKTRIGSPYVISAFELLKRDYSSVAGFEANGGYILASDLNINDRILSALPTRDAILPALMLLIASRRVPISQLVKKLPQRFTWSDRVKNFPEEKSKNIILTALKSPQSFINELGLSPRRCINVDETDGVRFILDNGDVLHLRPSGNAPELRCYTEAENEVQAKAYVELVFSKIV